MSEGEDEKEWQPKIGAQEFEPIYLTDMRGVAIKQQTQPLECCLNSIGLVCYLQQNNYQVVELPEDKYALRKLNDADGWHPTQEELDNLPYNMIANEKSNACVRCFTSVLCCPNYRPFKMQYFSTHGEMVGLEYRKEFTLGGICCAPHKMDVRLNGKFVGRVEENWNINNWCDQFLEYILCCNIPYKVKVSTGEYEFENKYDINVSLCIWGPHNNFCGSTPCRQNILFEVYKDKGDSVEYDEAVGFIQKTYGKHGGCTALTRWLFCKADNYVVEWPHDASESEKAVFLGAAVLIDYVFYENRKL